jgi:hypothetical protein
LCLGPTPPWSGDAYAPFGQLTDTFLVKLSKLLMRVPGFVAGGGSGPDSLLLLSLKKVVQVVHGVPNMERYRGRNTIWLRLGTYSFRARQSFDLSCPGVRNRADRC